MECASSIDGDSRATKYSDGAAFGAVCLKRQAGRGVWCLGATYLNLTLAFAVGLYAARLETTTRYLVKADD